MNKLKTRATDIELFMQCQWKYKLARLDKEPWPSGNALKMGTAFHTSRQSKKLALAVVRKLELPMDDFLRLKALIETPKFVLPEGETLEAYEIELDYSDENIEFRGHPDATLSREEGEFTHWVLDDYKSSAAKWPGSNEEVFADKHQWYIYLGMLAHMLDLKDENPMTFRYKVYVKKKAPPCPKQLFEMTLTAGEAKEKLSTALYEYVFAHKSGIFEKNPGQQCFYCPFKKICL